MKIHGVTGSRNDGLLSDSQQKALDRRQYLCAKRVQDYWGNQKRNDLYPEIAMPTGFGKGRVVHRLLKSSKHDQILTIVGSKNILLDQSKEVLEGLAMDDTGESDFSILPDLSGRVVLSTWQGLHSFSRKYTKRPNFGLAVIDEVHNVGTKPRIELLQSLKPEHAVGLTATAVRASGKFRTPEEYGFTVVDSMPLPDCIDKQWLSPLMGVSIDTQIMLPSSVRQNGSINQRKMAQALRKYPELFGDIARDVAERFLPSGMKTVIVVNRVEEEACVIAKELMDLGYKVGLAVNQNAAQQLCDRFITLDAIRRYKLPPEDPESIQVLISPQVIGEGFDAPATECVIWAAPTLSHVRYTQVIGRGSRRCWQKKYCLIVDYVYLIENYGYSLNFAQFFRKEDLQDLEDGFMYVGPEEIGTTIQLPSEFSRGGKIVSVVDLRRLIYPLAEGWFTCEQMKQDLERTEFWMRTKLKDHFPEAGEVRRDNTGQLALHYPPTVKEKLALWASKEKEAGDWLTVTQMGLLLERDHTVVQRRVSKLFSYLKEDRLTDSGHMRPHYPPSVLEELRGALSFKAKGYKKAPKGWLIMYRLALVVDRKRAWVESRLRAEDVKNAKMFFTDQSHQLLHYSPDTVKYLKGMVAKEKLAGDWLSCPEIAQKLTWSESLVRSLLKLHFASEGESRKSRANSVVCPHYPPSILRKLKEVRK